jgi:peptidoglycan/LPS O-acetylase OafA/YrhL
MAINYLPKAETLSMSPVKNIKFGISKVKKLYGLHLIMLAIMYVIVKMPTSGEAIPRLITDVLLLKCWRPHSEDYYSYNGVAWYLSMYLFVCMLAPYVMKLIAKIKNKKQLTGIAVLTYAFMLGIGYYVSVVTIPIGDGFAKWLTYICPLYRVLDFSLGAMLGWVYLNCDWKKYQTAGKAILLEIAAVAAFIIIEKAYLPIKENYMGIGYTVYFTLTAMLLVWTFAVNGSVITKALNNRVLLWLGNISSLTFLIHQVVIRWVKMNLHTVDLGRWYLPVVIVVCFAITVVGAEGYLFLQKKLKREKR